MLRQIMNLQQQHLAILVVLLLNPLLASAGNINQDLLEAARVGNTETVKALIDAGADVNARLKSGTTALMIASGSGHTETVRALIDAGADVNARLKNGLPP